MVDELAHRTSILFTLHIVHHVSQPSTPQLSFGAWALNTSNQNHVLPKGMVIGHTLPHPKEIVNLVSEEPPPVSDKPDVDGETWRQDVDLSHLPSEKRDAIYKLFVQHRNMWDGRLG
jgi:hypothetical protein